MIIVAFFIQQYKLSKPSYFLEKNNRFFVIGW